MKLLAYLLTAIILLSCPTFAQGTPDVTSYRDKAGHFHLVYSPASQRPTTAEVEPVPAKEVKMSTEPSEEEIELVIGWLHEFSKDPFADFGVIFSTIDWHDLRVSYELFDNPANYQRFYLNYGRLKLVDNEGFIWVVRPGVAFSNDEDFLAGADVDLIFPKARLQVFPRVYAGNNYDQAYVLSLWQPLESEEKLLIFHFWDINSELPATSFLGLGANLFDGGLMIGVAPSLTEGAELLTVVQGTLRW